LGTIQGDTGRISVADAIAQQPRLLAWVAIFGFFVNILVLTGPIFALQVYDRVLGSRSVETLVALTILMAFLFVIMGLTDHARRRIAARIAERIVTSLEKPVFEAMITAQAQRPPPTTSPLADLDKMRQFFASAIFVALFDLPWLPVFLAAIALFHPALGWLSVFGAAVILIPGLAKLILARQGTAEPAAHFWAKLVSTERCATFGLDMKETVFAQWQSHQQSDRHAALQRADRSAVLASFSQTFRLFLQSSVIGLGAFLVLQNQMTPGAIIAASVLLARALAPLDLVSQNADTLRQMRATWHRLDAILTAGDIRKRPTIPIRHGLGLHVDQLTVFPPGMPRAALRQVTFDLAPGCALGVTGASGSGKSTLAKTLIGLWPAAGGTIRLGGAALGQIAERDLALHIGYLPQNPAFHDGSIEQNISLFSGNHNLDALVQAASHAGVHDQIMALPDGYQTRLSARQNDLPGGLLQRIALARAVFGEPALLVLDEPGNNLDADGLRALNKVIRATCADGGSSIVLSQRPALLSACDRFLVLEHGIQKLIERKPPNALSVLHSKSMVVP